jgi:hypothetical protein
LAIFEILTFLKVFGIFENFENFEIFDIFDIFENFDMNFVLGKTRGKRRGCCSTVSWEEWRVSNRNVGNFGNF